MGQRKKKLNEKVHVLLLISLFILVALLSCQPTPRLPEATPPPKPEETITVMTYNILAGAGVDAAGPGWQEHAAQKGYPGNRLPKVLEVIRTANPDILGIQEATRWDRGSPSVVQEIADELGMNYFIAESNDIADIGQHVVLFTKFDIKEAERYSTPITKAALRAELVTPSGESIHVFVVHLHHADYEMRMTELSFLAGEMQLYTDDLAILIGDMNFRPFAREATVLYPTGWAHCLGQWIDQIWASPKLAPHVSSGPDILDELTSGVSDHWPVVAKVVIPPR